MDAAKPQDQEQERKASMETKAVKVFSSEEEADSSEEDAGEPVQNHRGWKAMPYVIGEYSYHPYLLPDCLSLLYLGITMLIILLRPASAACRVKTNAHDPNHLPCI
jgi:hypothetical protein